MSWQFQYWNGSSWLPFSNAQVDHVLEELSGHEELVLSLPNNSANRFIIQSKPFIQVLFNGSVIYPINGGKAILAAPQYSPTTITVTAYNYVFVQLSQASQTVTQNYTNTAVGTIAAYICGLAGVAVGSMPNLSVSIKFQDTNCFTALQNLAAACGEDYWGDSAFNIGTRDSTIQTLGYVGSNSKRGLDFSKQIDQVLIKGVDNSGVQIQGSAGTLGGSIATFTDKKVSDVATLNQLAAYKLQTLNNPSNGTSLECLISQVASWHPGQYISANRADLVLQGSFIIKRITKYAVSCSVEVDAAMPQMDILLQETDQYADLGTYQAQPSTQTPSALTLQGLLHLYHLAEGSGATANDSTPNGSAKNGAITNGSWINGAISGTKVLSFSGNGYVDCPNTDVLTNALAIGCWYSPSQLIDHEAMIGKNNNYLLEISGTQGAIRFGLHIGGSWVYLTAPTGTIQANGRGFALAVYDGSKMYLYVANPQVLNQLLTYSQAQTGSLDSSSADLYLAASGYKGVVAEVMIWSRALSGQEVQELFFRPLTRIIAKSGGVIAQEGAVDVVFKIVNLPYQ